VKENSIEDRIKEKYTRYINCETDILELTIEKAIFILEKDASVHYVEDLLQEAYKVILSDYKRVLKENEELKKSKITYEAVRDIQEKNRNIVDNNYISKQIVKDNLIKYQEEYELLLEHQSGKESNRTKYLRGRIHMCQELLEGRK